MGVKEVRALAGLCAGTGWAIRPAHCPFPRRDSSFQPSAAGHSVAGRRGRADHSGRRHDRESVFSRSTRRWSAEASSFSLHALTETGHSKPLSSGPRIRPGAWLRQPPNLKIDPQAIDLWATMSDGDARRALMGLEVAVLSQLEEAGFGKARRRSVRVNSAAPEVVTKGEEGDDLP